MNTSFLQLFMTAHPVVQFVMVGLLLASIWAWAIIIEKLFAFRRARREADRFEQQFWSGQSLEELYAGLSRGRTLSMAALFVAACVYAAIHLHALPDSVGREADPDLYKFHFHKQQVASHAALLLLAAALGFLAPRHTRHSRCGQCPFDCLPRRDGEPRGDRRRASPTADSRRIVVASLPKTAGVGNRCSLSGYGICVGVASGVRPKAAPERNPAQCALIP